MPSALVVLIVCRERDQGQERQQQTIMELSGRVGFCQAQVEQFREQLALEAPKPEPIAVEPTPEPEAAPEGEAKPWWKFWR